jgi:purine-binding chemotaxis protein CheW
MSGPARGAAAPGTIGWAEITQRLSRDAAIDPDDPAQRQQVLRARAAALARPLAEPAEDGGADAIEVLAFEVGGERYAVATGWVAQASAMPPLTALPGVPNYVAGIVPWRGQVLAAVDLRSLLALPLTRLADPAGLVVLQGADMEFGLLADAIVGVQRYPQARLERSLPGLENIRPGYLLGVTPDRTAILDAAALLADTRLVVHVGQ